METADAAGEWRRLSERYRQMSDDELLILAQKNSELTEAAQQALTSEVLRRGLKVQPVGPPAPPIPEPPDSPYAEDRELFEICRVWSLRDALQVQMLLDRAGIPFYMGPERAMGVDQVTSGFANGLSVQIMRIGWPWAWRSMRDYTPLDEPETERPKELPDFSVRCPKCQSTDIIFERLVPKPPTGAEKSSAEFEWTCAGCSHKWKDDGVVRET